MILKHFAVPKCRFTFGTKFPTKRTFWNFLFTFSSSIIKNFKIQSTHVAKVQRISKRYKMCFDYSKSLLNGEFPTGNFISFWGVWDFRKWKIEKIELFLCLTYQRIIFIFGFFSDSSSDVRESVSHDSVESISLNLDG